MMMAIIGEVRLASALHLRWYLYPVLIVASVAVTAIGVAVLVACWPILPRRERPLPRWAYGLLACCWLAAAVGCWSIGVRLPRSSWQADAWGFSMFACALVTLVLTGRAATWGPVRRLFWARPPASI